MEWPPHSNVVGQDPEDDRHHNHEHRQITVDPVPGPVAGSVQQVFVVNASVKQQVLAELTDGAALDASLFDGREVTLFATAQWSGPGSVGLRFRGTGEEGQRI
ncbi:MAG: hypothetical protein AAGA32_08320 [Pseudomonadota bacterium]